MNQFFAELKRRDVPRTAIAYLAAAWLLVEVADTTFPRFGIDDSAIRDLIVILAIGFIPALVLSWFFELTPEGLRRELASDAASNNAPRTNRKADRIILLMLLAAVGLLAADKFILDPSRDAARIEAATEAARNDAILGAYADKSIAVLAFDDLSPGSDHEYFSDGMAEELLNMLSKVNELRVISRSSAFTFKGSKDTVPVIAEKLNVSYILEGSIRKYGNNIRVTAQLIDGRTDTHMWSQNYDRVLTDVFAIQDEISHSIVEKLKLTLLDELPESQQIDAYAYDRFLNARHIVHSNNMAQLVLAESFLNEVLQEAPDYIPALNTLGRLYNSMPWDDKEGYEQNLAKVLAVAERVMAIEPDGVSAALWQAHIANRMQDLQAVANALQRAMAIDPNDLNLLRLVVPLLIKIGRHEDAAKVSSYLLQRDPSCGNCIFSYSLALRASGDIEQAEEVLNRLLEWVLPTGSFRWSSAVALLLANRPQEALEAFQKLDHAGHRELGGLLALHDLGRTREFEQAFDRFRHENQHPEVIARTYAWIGDADQAFFWIEKVIEEDGPHMLRLIDTDMYAKIKSDPRWNALRSAHGFSNTNPESVEFTFSLPEG